jgi:hypothetical protein
VYLGQLLFLAYVNDIWKNIESTVRLFADDCIIFRKTVNNKYIEKLQVDLKRLGKWVVEHAMEINLTKSKAASREPVWGNRQIIRYGKKYFRKRAVVNTWE